MTTRFEILPCINTDGHEEQSADTYSTVDIQGHDQVEPLTSVLGTGWKVILGEYFQPDGSQKSTMQLINDDGVIFSGVTILPDDPGRIDGRLTFTLNASGTNYADKADVLLVSLVTSR